MKRALLNALGFALLALGGIGALVPVLPTTPFVLCAAGCFGASNPALAKKLERARFFGEYIRAYRDKTGVSARTRWTGIAALWAMLGVSAALARAVHVWIVLVAVGVCVTAHLLLIGRDKAGHKR